MPHPVHCREVPCVPGRGGKEADGHVRPGAEEAQGVEAAVVHARGVRLQHVDPLRPGCRRVPCVEATDVGDGFPQLPKRVPTLELGIDHLRPRACRRGHDAPVRRASVDDLARLRQVRQEIAAGASGVDAEECAWRMWSRERDPSSVLLGEVHEPLDHPRRDVVERVVCGVLDPLALQPLVEVQDVDVLGAALVSGAGQGARQLLFPDVARDRHELPGLDVGSEDRELGKLRGPLLDLTHGRTLARVRMAQCGSTPTSRARGLPPGDARTS